MAGEKVKVLLVDDQPAKLMSLELILADLELDILKADCADAALKILLQQDIAVVLVDVCMPRMDGFELAELIRGHPRFAQTAIIFISAVHLTDADRLRGYGLGAVDYIPVPIIPEVLRAKVSVFADLFRKTEQLEQLNRELERRVDERTSDLEASTAGHAASEKRYRQLVQGLPAAVYTCDANGFIQLFNQAAAELWGREPVIGTDKWCGSLRLLRPDGSPLAHEESPMAVTLLEGVSARDREMIIERADGSRRIVLSHPDTATDEKGRVIGAVNMLVDVTDARRAEQTRILLANIVSCSDDAIISKSLDGRVLSWNAGAQTMLGYTAEEIVGRPVTVIIPEERWPEEQQITEKLRRGDRIQHLETVRRAKDGRHIDVSLTISVMHDEGGRVVGASSIARDISERKRAEEVLARDRETLERLVAERTAELQRSTERLRISDRMATIGTLSAGLGHDMGNLLLPVRMRLDVIDRIELPAEVREDVAAIREAIEYLQRLAGSLRLLALDPTSSAAGDASTDVSSWWRENEGMIRIGVPRTAMLTASLPDGLPAARIGKAPLTQVVFNLVQNAGEAVRGRSGQGQVTLAAAHDEQNGLVRITVSDNGPGMSEEVRRRCLEPFFTTKTRELSTGMGLALVAGIVQRIGGRINVSSTTGVGTAIEVAIPVATRPGPDDSRVRSRGVAIVRLADPRLFAHVESVLSSLHYQVKRAGKPEEGDVWVGESADAETAEAARFVSQGGAAEERRVLVLESGPLPAPGANGGPRVIHVEARLKPSVLRARLREVLIAPVGAEAPVPTAGTIT